MSRTPVQAVRERMLVAVEHGLDDVEGWVLKEHLVGVVDDLPRFGACIAVQHPHFRLRQAKLLADKPCPCDPSQAEVHDSECGRRPLRTRLKHALAPLAKAWTYAPAGRASEALSDTSLQLQLPPAVAPDPSRAWTGSVRVLLQLTDGSLRKRGRLQEANEARRPNTSRVHRNNRKVVRL
jgi:hypothetical protein